jgi:hypothetical protein
MKTNNGKYIIYAICGMLLISIAVYEYLLDKGMNLVSLATITMILLAFFVCVALVIKISFEMIEHQKSFMKQWESLLLLISVLSIVLFSVVLNKIAFSTLIGLIAGGLLVTAGILGKKINIAALKK